MTTDFLPSSWAVFTIISGMSRFQVPGFMEEPLSSEMTMT